MLIRILIPMILLLVTSCVQKAGIHEILAKRTLTVKPVLVLNKNIDPTLQEVAFKKLVEQISNPPLDVKLKSQVLKRGVSVLVSKGSVENTNDYDFLSEKYRNADVLIVMEIKSVKAYEKKYVSYVEDEFGTKYYCVERQAIAIVLFNVLNPKTQEVFFAKSYKGFDYKRYCDEKTYKPEKLPQEKFIVLKAIERTVGAFIRDFYSIL